MGRGKRAVVLGGGQEQIMYLGCHVIGGQVGSHSVLSDSGSLDPGGPRSELPKCEGARPKDAGADGVSRGVSLLTSVTCAFRPSGVSTATSLRLSGGSDFTLETETGLWG